MKERLDGTVRITHQGRALQCQVITARPAKATPAVPILYTRRNPVKPMPDHPWKRRVLPERRNAAAAIDEIKPDISTLLETGHF